MVDRGHDAEIKQLLDDFRGLDRHLVREVRHRDRVLDAQVALLLLGHGDRRDDLADLAALLAAAAVFGGHDARVAAALVDDLAATAGSLATRGGVGHAVGRQAHAALRREVGGRDGHRLRHDGLRLDHRLGNVDQVFRHLRANEPGRTRRAGRGRRRRDRGADLGDAERRRLGTRFDHGSHGSGGRRFHRRHDRRHKGRCRRDFDDRSGRRSGRRFGGFDDGRCGRRRLLRDDHRRGSDGSRRYGAQLQLGRRLEILGLGAAQARTIVANDGGGHGHDRRGHRDGSRRRRRRGDGDRSRRYGSDDDGSGNRSRRGFHRRALFAFGANATAHDGPTCGVGRGSDGLLDGTGGRGCTRGSGRREHLPQPVRLSGIEAGNRGQEHALGARLGDEIAVGHAQFTGEIRDSKVRCYRQDTHSAAWLPTLTPRAGARQKADPAEPATRQAAHLARDRRRGAQVPAAAPPRVGPHAVRPARAT